MEYEVCVYVEDPPRYLKFYKTIRDYDRCNVSKIVMIGNPSSPKDLEQYRILKEVYEDVVVEFIDENKDREKAEELLMICRSSKHLIILEGGYIR